MGTTPEIIELMKLQLRKWQFSESFIEFVEMLGPQERSMHSQQRKLLEAVEHVISAFSHTQQAGLLLAENADIDAILIALAYQAALLDQLATSSRDNSDTNGYEALVSSMRKNVLPLVKQLGMWDFKRGLEGALLRLIAPQQYEEVRTWYHRFQLDHQESWKPLLEAIQTQCAKIVRGCEAKVVYCGIEGARRRLVRLGGYDHAQIQHFAKIYLIVPHLIDCYSALAAIHAVGLPEPYSLLDMIRTPQSNGYSGLLTNICFDRDDVSEEQGRRVFEIVILTHLMEGVAHQGVTYPLCYQFIKGNVPHLDPLDEKYCIHCLIQGLKREQAQQNATITVFTARGQAKQLKTGSTILDLAYKLHSEIGNHAESAVVNGKWVPLSTTLKNGDQVKINRTDHQRVRSEADLQYVADPATKRRIYKFLNKEPTSKGRHLLATYLRNRDPKKGTENLDNEVTAICAYLGVHNAEELYRMIAEKKEIAALPGQPFATPGLVGALIMQRRRSVALDVQPLASSGPANDWIPVLDEPGNVTLPFRYCGICRPNPTSQIVGMRTKKSLAVHTVACYVVRGKPRVSMHWQLDIRNVKCILSLRASDRPLLIQNITEVIYRNDTGLGEIRGKSQEHGGADVELHVYVKSAVNVVELMIDLTNIRSVQRVKLEQTTLPPNVKLRIQRGPLDRHLINDLEREGHGKSRGTFLILLANAAQRYGDIILGYNDQKPTFSKDVFFGRQDEVSALQYNLVSAGGGVMLVAGPRRSGKTSLCLRFLDDISSSTRSHLIRVDLRTRRQSSSSFVFEDIGNALSSRLHLPASPCRSGQALISLVEKACSTLQGEHIVFILDEFGGPLESFAHGILGRELFEFINAVLDRELPLSIILVTPPRGFDIMNRYDIWSILRPMRSISLGPLEVDAASEMIVRPFKQCGVHFNPGALKKVLFLTGHYPYYIINLLKEILFILNAQQSKIYVTDADVELATKKLLCKDAIFNYICSDARRTAFAENCLHILATSRWSSHYQLEYATERFSSYITEGDLFSLLAKDTHFSKSEARLAVEQLVEDKILDKQFHHAGIISYKFSIPLFHHWLQKSTSWLRK